MTNSHEVINLETMAQCLADARALLREGDMCADTYVSLLEEAARQIRSVLTFVQDVGLELTDEDETEACAILDRHSTVLAHRRSTSFQGGDYDLYHDLHQSLGDTLVLEPGPDGGKGTVKGSIVAYSLGCAADWDPESNFGKLKAACDAMDEDRRLREKSLREWIYFPFAPKIKGAA